MQFDKLLALVIVFVPFSLLSIGGGSAIIAGIQHESVNVHGWLTNREFVEIFAMSRAAPGPGVMLATLIGWEVAGWWGAIAATLALFVPSSLLCYAVLKFTNSHRDKKWHRAMREGLAPVGIGLTIAGTISIFRLSGGGIPAALVSILSAAIMAGIPKFPVLGLLCLSAGGAALLHEWPLMQ